MRLLMGFVQEPKLEMRLSIICQVCKLSVATRSNFDVVILGARTKYNVCKCGREIESPDTNYKRRWRYWNKKVNFHKEN